jgi:hypothetical protein
MDQNTPAILRLPVELLQRILLIVIPLIKYNELYRLRYRLLEDSPFHTLRSTCRIFRWMVDDLPFWQSDTFRLPFTLTTDYFEVLLSDSHLQQCLARKTGWSDCSLQVVQILKRHVPQFGQRVHYLRLNNNYTSKSWGKISETLCGAFPVLMVLELSSDTHVHLDILPPTLWRFELHAPPKDNCHCFNTLPHLEQFSYHHHSCNPLHFKKLLPFKFQGHPSRISTSLSTLFTLSIKTRSHNTRF